MRRTKIFRGQMSLIPLIVAEEMRRENKKENKEEKREEKKEAKKRKFISCSKDIPKALAKATEKYMNEPYNMTRLEAFKKAAGEYKKPSKKLLKAIEKDDYRHFIPSAYEKERDFVIKRCLCSYNFKRYVGQKVFFKGKLYTIGKVHHYYTYFEGHGDDTTQGPLFATPYDGIRPEDDIEYLVSLRTELEYRYWWKERCSAEAKRYDEIGRELLADREREEIKKQDGIIAKLNKQIDKLSEKIISEGKEETRQNAGPLEGYLMRKNSDYPFRRYPGQKVFETVGNKKLPYEVEELWGPSTKLINKDVDTDYSFGQGYPSNMRPVDENEYLNGLVVQLAFERYTLDRPKNLCKEEARERIRKLEMTLARHKCFAA